MNQVLADMEKDFFDNQSKRMETDTGHFSMH